MFLFRRLFSLVRFVFAVFLLKKFLRFFSKIKYNTKMSFVVQRERSDKERATHSHTLTSYSHYFNIRFSEIVIFTWLTPSPHTNFRISLPEKPIAIVLQVAECIIHIRCTFLVVFWLYLLAIVALRQWMVYDSVLYARELLVCLWLSSVEVARILHALVSRFLAHSVPSAFRIQNKDLSLNKKNC